MSKKNRELEEEVEEVEEVEEEVADEIEEETPKSKKESPAKTAYRALIEAYKVRNPVKYAQKKAELEKKLANL